MKKITLAFIILYSCLAGCNSEKCTEHVYPSTVAVDVSDTLITKQFKREVTLVAEKITPTNLKRCEGVQIDILPIGASIENHTTSVLFPANGVLNSNIGNYDLNDSNNIKLPALCKGVQDALDGFKAIGGKQSQIFYTLTQILNNKKGRIVVYTDLLEHYGISFYKPGFDFEKTYTALLKQYSLDSARSKFTGTITVVSPLEKNQDRILYARKFFAFYFGKIGIAPNQYEFIGSISQTKF